MQTRLSNAAREIIIGDGLPTVLIGERLNPTGKPKLAQALRAGDMDFIIQEAQSQLAAGADILDINVVAEGVNEVALLPRVVQIVSAAAGAPLCLDSIDPTALEAGLKVYRGKALINSVNGEERSLSRILPLVKEYKTAVVALTMDENGIPDSADRRLAIAYKITDRAAALGILPEDIIFDCLATMIGVNNRAGVITMETVRCVRQELGSNLTLGASNFSYGLPDRPLLNSTFLTMMIACGINCPIVDAARVRPMVLAADLVLGRDRFALSYIKGYRQNQPGKTA
jgi:5-methyltetrahydrofolate--homocysteine methyltransferase